jgi:hypothetical protein
MILFWYAVQLKTFSKPESSIPPYQKPKEVESSISISEKSNSSSQNSSQNTQNSSQVSRASSHISSQKLKIKEYKKRSNCWKYFKSIVDHNGIKQDHCQLNTNENLPCTFKRKHSTTTTRLNEHLANVHGLSPFKKSLRVNKSETHTMHTLLVYFIIGAALPFSIIENNYFIKFVSALNSVYKLPNRKKLAELIEEIYDHKRTIIRNQLDSAKSISITTDSWTSHNQKKSFISLSSHFINECFKLVSFNLG